MEETDLAREALDRATAAGLGHLAEPLGAYTERAQFDGLTMLRAEDAEGSFAFAKTSGEGNVLFCGCASKVIGRFGLRLNVAGNNNVIFVGPHARLSGIGLDIKGDENVFYIGAFVEVGNLSPDLHVGLTVNLRGRAGRIVIGDRSVLETDVVISNADGHAIYDRGTGERINRNADVLIGERVFVGRGARINKGVRIADGAVVEDGAIVAGHLKASCSYGGAPARLLREDVTWSRVRGESWDEAADAESREALRVERLRTRIAGFAA